MPEVSGAFPDTIVPGLRVRNRFLVGAADGPTAAMVSDSALNVELLTCPPGERLGAHDHPHSEAFFVLDGTWEVVTWSEGAEPVERTVSSWDLVWVPPGMWREARNIGQMDAHLLVLAGPTSGCDLEPGVATAVAAWMSSPAA